MKIIRAKDYNDMSRKAANIISAQVILKPDSVLGLATGSSPIGIYEQLIKWYNKGDVDFGGCTTFNLDEYRGLTPDHEQSYHYFMHKNFFDAVNVPAERINLQAFFGPVTPQVPASILQLHTDVSIVADEAALSKCGDLL